MKPQFLLRKIKKEFPCLQWKKYKYLDHGWDHYVIMLDNSIVFRFPKSEKIKKKLYNEIKLLNYLNLRLKVGIPEYKYIAKDNSFAGYNMVPGQQLRLSLYVKLGMKKQSLFAQQMASFLTSLHQTPRPAIKRFHISRDVQRNIYQALIKSTRRYIFPRVSKKDVNLIQAYFDELRDSLKDKYQKVLTHNDLAWEHILWEDKKNKVNIIDFTDRSLSDPASDFTGLLQYGEEFTKGVFDKYRSRKDKNLLKRAKLYFKRVPLWVMKDSFEGYPCTFQEGYEMFKARFK